MTKTKPPPTGKYLYAIINGNSDQFHGPAGIAGGKTYTIKSGKLAAVVSDVADQRLRPERRHLAAHQKVLEALMASGTPLPVTFGVIAQNQTAVRKIIASNRQDLLAAFDKISGKMEMGLRVAWNTPNIFAHFVETHQELRQARDRLYGGRGQPTQDGKIELGRLFERILSREREMYTAEVEKTLSPHCHEILRNKCRDERWVMDLVCLVDRNGEGDFEKGVFQAASRFDNSFSFDYSGPWVPHSFVEMELELEL